MTDNRELVIENDQWAIYSTGMTRIMQKDLDSFTSHGVRIGDRYKIYLGEKKDVQDTCFLIFDRRTGAAVHYFNDYREIDLQKMILEMILMDEDNIVEMAKRRLEE